MSNMRQQIRVFVDRELSPAARSARLASVARSTVADLVATGRGSPRYETSVDGVPGASEDVVRPDGRITYGFQYIGEATEFALAFMIARTDPAQSGALKRGFVVAVNGRGIPARQFRKESVPTGAEVFIYNTEPYWRKVDTGVSGSRFKPHRYKYRIPSGVVDDAVREVKRRFGNSVTAERKYTVMWPGQLRQQRGDKRLVDSPALVIRGLA